jgi:tetraacyldisaccharide 4'-kinase
MKGLDLIPLVFEIPPFLFFSFLISIIKFIYFCRHRMDKLRLILLPFSLIYGLIVLIRNKFYDWAIFKSTAFDLPIICVGNLAVGGSGKTPVTEYLVKLLTGNRIAILSRGYGRRTKGFILADHTATAETIGDEPLQYFKKFSHITVAVCEDRVKGVQQLGQNHDVILLDDAYQHRSIKAGFNILLFEFAKLKKWQFLLPAGNLRESFNGVKRADQILVTKLPDNATELEKAALKNKFDLEPTQNIAFSNISYGGLVHLFGVENHPSLKNKTIFVLTGIANPKPMLTYLSGFSNAIQHFDFPDHYSFKRSDLTKLVMAFESCKSAEKIIITTEKDSQRLLANDLKDLLLNLPIYYLPIEIAIAENDKAIFDKKILNYVANAKRIN